MDTVKIVCALMLICIVTSFALEPATASLEPIERLRGDEKISSFGAVSYLGGRQSPGDQIGITWYDVQTI